MASSVSGCLIQRPVIEPTRQPIGRLSSIIEYNRSHKKIVSIRTQSNVRLPNGLQWHPINAILPPYLTFVSPIRPAIRFFVFKNEFNLRSDDAVCVKNSNLQFCNRRLVLSFRLQNMCVWILGNGVKICAKLKLKLKPGGGLRQGRFQHRG